MSNHEREGSRTPAGDDALDRVWQQVSDEQPPPALDAAIIAAAHKSTRGGNEQAQVNRARPPQRSWLTRWQPLAAAAAVAGLAFVLVQSLPRDHDVATSPRMEERATTPAAAQEKPVSPATREAIEAKTASPPATSRRSRVSHGTGRRDRPEIRGRAGDDDARGRSRSTTACGAGDDGAGFGGRGSRSSSTDTGTGTDNGIGRGIGSSSESCKRQRGATRRHGPCSESRDSPRRGRYRRRGRRTARVPCSRSGRGHLPPGIAP